mmetsp:Transcript_6880/g.20986  ORF Transcript_6880/g.20986 Transcript_6880/m.20986 type:complete len:435 (-) Transcript_6880:9-1313(-)
MKHGETGGAQSMDEQQHQDGRKNASHHDVGADPDSSHAHIESGADADEVSGMPHSVVAGACRSGDEQEGSSETVDDAQDSELDELEVNDDSDGTDGSECSSSSSSSSTTNSSSSASVSASASATASLQSTNAATAVVKCTESSAVVVGEGSTSVASTALESSDGKKKKNRKNRKRNKKKKKKKNSKVQSSQTHSDTKHEETSSTDDSHSVSPSSPLSPSASSASTLKTNSSAVTLVLPASVPPSSSSSSSRSSSRSSSSTSATTTTYTYPPGSGFQPVRWVSLPDARAYCAFTGGRRLPHEWEWQLAAQGRSQPPRRYPWGEQAPQPDVHCPPFDTSRHCPQPADVDAYPQGQSCFGVRDLVGNTWEWTDEYQDRHTRAAVLKGGSRYRPQGSDWYFPQAQTLDTHGKYLLMAPSIDRSAMIGFRCVSDLPVDQ